MTVEELAKAVSDGDGERAKVLTEQLLKKGLSPSDLIEKGLAKGLRTLGDRWVAGEVFLAEIMLAVAAFGDAKEALKAHLKLEEEKILGTVVIGTVEGDIHYIGKNIVATMLEGAGFKVMNVGEDVSVDRFCSAVESTKPDILGMSCLISPALHQMKEVIEELKTRNLREDLIVMVGGPPLSSEYAEEMGADIYSIDAFDAVAKAKEAIT
ncbi:cobalamin-dependent protein [Candidatus Bathyarchaeota archaeon]|nr:cobalamin-dependent protein [Candidatus Bathyarchaeota archaeon]